MSLPVHAVPYALKPLSVAEIRERHAEMYRALRDEADALRKEGSRPQLTLPAAELQEMRGTFAHYRFSFGAAAVLPRPGQDAQCIFDKTTLACTVVETAGRDLVLALPRSLGPRIPAGGVLLTDTVWLVEALQQRLCDGILSLTTHTSCNPQFNFTTALRIIGDDVFEAAERLPDLRVFRGGVSLNAEQHRAVRLAYGSNACFVFGPPGTGKTATLARIVEAHVLAGSTVLALGPSNTAVDVVMCAVADRLSTHPRYAQGAVLRYGARATARLRRTIGPMVAHDQVVARLREERFAPAAARLTTVIDAIEREAGELDAALHECAAPRGPSPTSAFMDSLRRRRQRAGRVLNRLAAQRRQVLRASVLLPRRLLDRCSVLGTTVHQTYVSRELKRQYDVVVIDEASMTQTAQVYACSALARTGGKVIVAGDFRQIPPVVAAKTLRARTWLATDIFHTVGIPDDLERDDAPPYLAMLVEQHRMSPGICAIVDHLFYGDRLKTHPSVRSRPCLPTPLGETDVFYVDSSARVPRVRSPDRKTRANEVHVDIVEDLLAELDSGGAIPRTGQRQVAVIAPFRGQVEAIRKRLGKRYHGRGVDVSTGHKSQGGEAEIVILDLTDAPGLPISDFLGARSITEAGPRAVNVGMSRARQQLYIVGAMDFLEQAGGRVIRQLVAYLRENAQHVRPAQIRGSAAKVYGHMEKKSLAPSLHRRGAPAGSHAGGRRHTRGTAAS